MPSLPNHLVGARAPRLGFLAILVFVLLESVSALRPSPQGDAIDIGSRLEPLVDDFVVERLQGARLVLHAPQPRETAITHDAGWEGNASGYVTVIQEGSRYRMYYRGHRFRVERGRLKESQPEVTCYAESDDGIRWRKPELGLFEWNGSKKNNIVWRGEGVHNFTPFRDGNTATPPEARYKAIGGVAPKGLYAFQSADGIHWKKLAPEPVFSKGAFDSQNVPFWDPSRRTYALYYRFFSEGEFKGRRSIGVTHSSDFLTWPVGTPLAYPGAPAQQLYTNQVMPYPRAPHLLVGFPTRYVARPLTEHVKTLPPVELRSTLASGVVRAASDITDGLFMTSRDGVSFRLWSEAFVRPGPQHENRWIYGDNYQSLGLVETTPTVPGGPSELSFYMSEGSWRDAEIRQRRYALRLDGFVSAQASFAGGEIVTRPIRFDGSRLTVNYSTSAAGSLKVEIQDPSGRPLPGFALEDSEEHYGDSVRQVIRWRPGPDVASLSGRPVRVRFVLRDGDLYAFQFGK